MKCILLTTRKTRNRIKDKDMVFAIQDTTYLDYDSHIKTQELGSISKNYTKHKQGLIMHSTLIVTRKGLPLGLASGAMLYSYCARGGAKRQIKTKICHAHQG